jgi:hypothetical protein
VSLINEALKKAQREQASRNSPQLPDPAQPQPVTKPPRRYRYLRGFVLSLLLIGTLTTLFTTYFLRQLLPEEEEEVPAPPAHDRIPAEDPPVPLPVASPAPATEETASDQGPDPDPAAPAAPAAMAAEPDPALPPEPPDPEVLARLTEIEIRGIMSGSNTRVLIFDQATGRTRTYQEGQTLEGPMGLIVESITPNAIQFKDYAGKQHTKSF